jgi:OHCU decarboxylase
MDTHDFVALYGGIYEHSPWVAEEAFVLAADSQAVDDIDALALLMADCVDNAANERQLALMRAHPDLAGKARLAGELTAESASEQTSAGLDQCSAEELQRFRILNEAYRDKFGFPFILAVRGLDRSQILAAFAERLENDYEVEFETALQEIHKIARLRLDALRSGQ